MTDLRGRKYGEPIDRNGRSTKVGDRVRSTPYYSDTPAAGEVVYLSDTIPNYIGVRLDDDRGCVLESAAFLWEVIDG